MPKDSLEFWRLGKKAAVLFPSLPTPHVSVEHNLIPVASNSFLLSPLGDHPPSKDRRDRQSSG